MLVKLQEDILNRIYHLNRNFTFAITGGELGIGKSYSALSLAYILDPDFTADNIVFAEQEKEYIDLIRNKPKGSAIIWDELGVGLNTRDAMSFFNRVVNKVNQTARFRNQVIGYTLPHKDIMDSQSKMLLNGLFDVQFIDYKKQSTCCKFYRLRMTPFSNKPLYQRLAKNKYELYDLYDIPRPPKSIEAEYEKRRKEYFDNYHDNPFRSRGRPQDEITPIDDIADILIKMKKKQLGLPD